MRNERLRQIVDDIDKAIANRSSDVDQLWNLADLFWTEAFPEGISDEERDQVWAYVIEEYNLKISVNGPRVMEVLEWPASGGLPSWLE